MENAKTVEEVTVNKQVVRLIHEDVPLNKVVLDDDNPRIRYRLKLALNGHGKLDSVVMGMPEVKKLKKDIEDTGGLRERVILQEQDGMWKAVEGNCRVVCYKALNEKYPNDPKWKKVPAKILPKDVDPKQVAILLADFHVAQKIAWKPHEKAGHVYRMMHDLAMSPDEIATYLRASKSSVYRLERAYEFMIEKFLKIDKGAYKDAGERKWSYFEEFFKLKPLRERYEKDSEFGSDFCRWVGDGRLPEGENVRDLPQIIASPDAFKKFKDAPVADAFRLAMKVVEQANPEYGSEFFSLMADFRQSCRDAAQVKEILLIRSNKAARERVLDTYNAFVDFMRLADVEPPSIA